MRSRAVIYAIAFFICAALLWISHGSYFMYHRKADEIYAEYRPVKERLRVRLEQNDKKAIDDIEYLLRKDDELGHHKKFGAQWFLKISSEIRDRSPDSDNPEVILQWIIQHKPQLAIADGKLIFLPAPVQNE